MVVNAVAIYGVWRPERFPYTAGRPHQRVGNMAEVRTTACLALALLLASAPCAFARTQQSSEPSTQSTAEEEESSETNEEAEPSQQPPTVPPAPTPTVPVQVPATPAQTGLPPGSLAPTGTPPGAVAPAMPGAVAPAAAPGTVAPAPVIPGAVAPATVPGAVVPAPGAIAPVPGTVAPAGVVPGTIAPGTTAPAPYVPKTEFDNTPHRFNMTQDGKRMSANDFDAWMRAKGYRVAKGAPPGECPNAPPAGVETIVGPDGCPVEVSIELDGVTFEFAKSTLRPEAKKTLDQAIEILKRHPELTVEVAGHTDSRGDAAFNQKLSQARAKAVYDYMIGSGIAASQLDGPIGYGESKPIASNDTDAGREENRRTELNIKAVAALPAPAVAPQVSAGIAPTAVPAAVGSGEQVVVPASAAASEPVAAPVTSGTANDSIAAPAASTPAASGQPEAPATASGQPGASGTIETSAAGHVLVPATGGTTATGHVITPAATGSTTMPPGDMGQATVPATDAQSQTDATGEETAPAADDASDDDE